MSDTATRKCKTCNAILPITQFHRGKGYIGGRHPNCRTCRGTKRPDFSDVRVENLTLVQQGKARCNKCREVKSVADFIRSASTKTGYMNSCRKCYRVQMRPAGVERTRRLRLEAISRYGGRCFCCGEWRYEFMAIDHINGGGNRERKTNAYGPGDGFVKWLKRSGWPAGFRIACHNCNSSFGWYGSCPHSSASSFDELYAERAEEVARKKLFSEGLKRCSVCKAIRPVGEFIAIARSADGLRGVCKPCEKTASGKRRDAAVHGWTRETYLAASRKANRRLRLEAIDRYGVSCACCGEVRPEFLHVDHVDGGGNAHRRSLGVSSIPRWLKSRGWPPGYRTLCANCNLSLGFYGRCPHQGTSTPVHAKMEHPKEA